MHTVRGQPRHGSGRACEQVRWQQAAGCESRAGTFRNETVILAITAVCYRRDRYPPWRAADHATARMRGEALSRH